MRFPGFWVANDGGPVRVSTYVFDDTELSDHSNWKEAWQNEDPGLPHGFVDPLAALQEICRRLEGEMTDDQRAAVVNCLKAESGYEVRSLSDLVQLIQASIPGSSLGSRSSESDQ
jgi:hypothetical protein